MARRTSEDAIFTRESIVDAATQCFVRYGVNKTSLADVAALASVTRGAVYHHFAGKDRHNGLIDKIK